MHLVRGSTLEIRIVSSNLAIHDGLRMISFHRRKAQSPRSIQLIQISRVFQYCCLLHTSIKTIYPSSLEKACRKSCDGSRNCNPHLRYPPGSMERRMALTHRIRRLAKRNIYSLAKDDCGSTESVGAGAERRALNCIDEEKKLTDPLADQCAIPIATALRPGHVAQFDPHGSKEVLRSLGFPSLQAGC